MKIDFDEVCEKLVLTVLVLIAIAAAVRIILDLFINKG
jgi:hypothetical protein